MIDHLYGEASILLSDDISTTHACMAAATVLYECHCTANHFVVVGLRHYSVVIYKRAASRQADILALSAVLTYFNLTKVLLIAVGRSAQCPPAGACSNQLS